MFIVLDSDETSVGDSVDTEDTSVVVVGVDADGDGYPESVDCDDDDDAVHPGAVEICNGADDDCNDADDDNPSDGNTWFVDADDDDFGTDEAVVTCDETAPAGHAAVSGDCDDGEDAVNPDEDEVCNGIDDDCDGRSDTDDDDLTGASTFRFDGDDDGFGGPGTVTACEAPGAGWITTGGDCDDGDDTVHPGAEPRCDGLDHDCVGGPDADVDADGDGFVDHRCGGPDCDDTSQSTVPSGGGCVSGASCKDLLDRGVAEHDGLYLLDVDAGGPIDPALHHCLMSRFGGGFTLVGVNDDDGDWTTAAITSLTSFGEPSLFSDYKASGYRAIGMTDLLFTEPGGMYALYEGVGTGTSARQLFEDVPQHNCGLGTAGEQDAYEWEMTEGNLAHPELCSTNLYISVADYDGVQCGPNDDAVGPAWSVDHNSACPLDDPADSSFEDFRNGPWTGPVGLWVR